MMTLCALACVSTATGQETAPTKSESVRDRPRPEYDAAGVGLGVFRLYPRLTLGPSYDDNIFATETAEVDDLIGLVSGNVNLRSEGGRIPANAHAGFDSLSYVDNSGEDHTNWNIGGSVGYDLPRRTAVRLSGDYIRDHESRGEPSFPFGAVGRPKFDTGRVVLDVSHEFAAVGLGFGMDYESIDFDDAALSDGTRVDQDFRDRFTRTLQAQGAMAVSPSTQAFVRGVYTKRDFKVDSSGTAGLNRDATVVSLLGGAAFDYSSLMRGEVAIGFFDLDNSDPSQGDQTSIAINSHVEVYVTQLITATIDLERTSGASDIEGASSYIGTSASLGLDYELLRNLILSATWGHSRREYTDLDQDDTGNRATLGAEWLLNPWMRVGVDLTHTKRTWPVEQQGRSYGENLFAATVSFVL